MKNRIEFNIELIIQEYSNYVFKIIDKTIGNSLSYQDKEEAVSDTFYLLWKNQTKIKDNLKSYLGVIARNVAYQKLRENKINLEYKDEIIVKANNIPSSITIQEILSNLKEEEIEIFNLYYVKGFKIKEIAKLKAKSNSAIKMNLVRIRNKIKESSFNDEY